MAITEISSVPQIDVRPQRLVVARAPADAVIRGIRVGNRSQLADGGVPASMFAPNQVGTSIDFGTVKVGEQIVLVIESQEGGVFQAALLCEDYRGAQRPLGFSATLGPVEPLIELAHEKMKLDEDDGDPGVR